VNVLRINAYNALKPNLNVVCSAAIQCVSWHCFGLTWRGFLAPPIAPLAASRCTRSELACAASSLFNLLEADDKYGGTQWPTSFRSTNDILKPNPHSEIGTEYSETQTAF